MKSIILALVFLLPLGGFGQTNYPKLSADLLEAVKQNQPTDQFVQTLKGIDADELAAALNTDAKKKTFWINVYNSFIILLLRDNPALFEDRGAFFSA
ncbi:MAG: DUF547 domain-containing protein, partial [Bacteroidia bacterium]|nr:DUF547 domain-containing protein [Bacteroidia bacterium]